MLDTSCIKRIDASGLGKATMWKRVPRVTAVFALIVATGCYAHFDVAATRAAYATSSSDPSHQECANRVVRAQESFNTDGRWWSRSVVAGIVLASAIGVVAIATGRDTPGGDATTTAEAIDEERGFSRLELTTGALAGLAGVDALLAWYSTSEMSKHAREVADHLARCPPSPASSSLSRTDR